MISHASAAGADHGAPTPRAVDVAARGAIRVGIGLDASVALALSGGRALTSILAASGLVDLLDPSRRRAEEGESHGDSGARRDGGPAH